MATELENLVPEADVEIEGMRGPKGDKGDSYVLTEADKEEIAQKVDKIIDAETDKTLSISGKPADAKAAGDEINDLKADLNKMFAATVEDVNKALLVKTVTNGKVAEWKFGETDKTLTTEADYDNSDVVAYISSAPTNHNQYCVVISPDTTSDYYIKSAKVRASAKVPVKFSLFNASLFYGEQDAMKRLKFTKKYDIATIKTNEDGYAEIVFNSPLFINHTSGDVLVASTQTNVLYYGSYKSENTYNIFNYTYSWFDLKNGEYQNTAYGRATNVSQYFELNYIDSNNVDASKTSVVDYLQKEIDFPQYDSEIKPNSENAVRNSAIYNETNIITQETIGTDEITYSNTNSFTPRFSNRTAIRIFVPETDPVVIKSIDSYCATGKSVRYGLWSYRRQTDDPSSVNYNRVYLTPTRILGDINESGNHAVIDFGDSGLEIDPTTDIILAATDSAALGIGDLSENVSKSNFSFYGNTSLYSNEIGVENTTIYEFTPIYNENVSSFYPSVFSVTYKLKTPKVVTTVTNVKEAVTDLLEQSKNCGIGWLSNKKWAACGDSVTQGIDQTIGEDGYRHTYVYYIAKRNGILNTEHLHWDGVSGSTMAMCTGKETVSFANLRYKDIPLDTDIITLWFGINDKTEIGLGDITGVGTIDDTDIHTFYGAYNTVLTYFINNIPNVKIGLVVTHRCGDAIRDAIRALALKYGLKTFDIYSDANIPFWHPDNSLNADKVDAAIKQKRISDWWYEPVNSVHPLSDGYEYISYPFEEWMKSL